MNGRMGEASASPAPGAPAAPAGMPAGAAFLALAGRTGSGRGTAAAAWPLFSALGPLGALVTAPRLARTFTALVLGGWGLDEAADAGQVIVSELTTNVVQAAAGPGGHPVYDETGRPSVLWLRLMTSGPLLRIEVWDTLPAACGVPVRGRAAPDAESGRGLEIVAGLSQDWGWEPVPGHRAKRVWAVLAVPRRPHPAATPPLRDQREGTPGS